MLKVTDSAKKELSRIIKENAEDSSEGLRVDLNDENELGLILDQIKENDHIIKSKSGKAILLISPEIYEALASFKVDYSIEAGITINEVE